MIDQGLIKKFNAEVERGAPSGSSSAGEPTGGARGLSLSQARANILKAFAVVSKLAEAETNVNKQIAYGNAAEALLAELTAVTDRLLEGREGAYSPITSSLKAAAGKLHNAYNDAKALKGKLDIATDALNGLGSLVGALGSPLGGGDVSATTVTTEAPAQPSQSTAISSFLKEGTASFISIAITVVALLMLILTFYSAFSPKIDANQIVPYFEKSFERQKDILMMALALLGTVTGYYLGRAPAERQADAVRESSELLKKQVKSQIEDVATAAQANDNSPTGGGRRTSLAVEIAKLQSLVK